MEGEGGATKKETRKSNPDNENRDNGTRVKKDDRGGHGRDPEEGEEEQEEEDEEEVEEEDEEEDEGQGIERGRGMAHKA